MTLGFGAAAGALILAVTACASSTASGFHSPPLPTSPHGRTSSGTTSYPTLPPTQIVLQAQTCCGFVGPPAYLLGQQPYLTVYGDGTVLIADPANNDAAWRIKVGHLTPASLDRLVAEADNSGLFDGRADFGRPGVSDMPGTTVVFRPDAAASREADVYALEFDSDSGLSAVEQRNRTRLRALVADAQRAVVPDAAPYVVDRVEVLPVAGGWAGPEAPAWPGPTTRGLLSRQCSVLTGADARAVFAAAVRNRGATWHVGHRRLMLVVRALVPGRQACAARG